MKYKLRKRRTLRKRKKLRKRTKLRKRKKLRKRGIPPIQVVQSQNKKSSLFLL